MPGVENHWGPLQRLATSETGERGKEKNQRAKIPDEGPDVRAAILGRCLRKASL